jgi:hypothetical protein
MSTSNPYFVITSINACTEPVRRFARLFPGLVIGDKKSPAVYDGPENVAFISLAEQGTLGFSCASLLPTGHYGRKNIGYLEALRRGASLIVDTDDDNYPLENFYLPGPAEKVQRVRTSNKFFNCYRLFADRMIWPRGYPVSQARQSWHDPHEVAEETVSAVNIWQGLVNGDPDVDAIYRIIHPNDGQFVFPHPGKVVLDRNVFCPFNSQNTVFYPPAFPLLYLPVSVSFRFTDILRSIVAVPILEAYGQHLGFCEATAFQQRNEHDLKIDLLQELTMYLETEPALDLVRATVSPSVDMSANLLNVYRAFLKESIVTELEVEVLTKWLQDLASLS